MYEYKVEKSAVKNAEKLMNELAKEGYRVVAVNSNIAKGFGMVITFEREIK